MKVAILVNGSYDDYKFCDDIDKNDYIICADNGLSHAKKLGVVPNIILGDFDSVNPEILKYFENQNIPIIRFIAEKDETDTELALHHAFGVGATDITIYGGVGTRFDHSLANVHLLYQALQNGVTARLKNKHNIITLIDKRIEISGKEKDLVSLIPFTPQVTGVTTTNLAYKLNMGQFSQGNPYGISNYMTSHTACIEIEQGLLLVIQAKD
ncbi:thiamine diphosphokinase [Candidatus Epulonipiscium fishelsonii]|uniref:Thiamine diphosphokinase n=1 Tax=Candidatus Epulonipiscium fishelsonii TaxID=77094 RepID=A0ACC8XG13_9FIRM|nr:thiamine diphosphokinase [Epulopiscium sp. SCG-B11WGA-EpuloA1]ONI42876.1 thiamine diphosphokinase [Epulopiscium sp. SCG-B05WGA-EpuloA1]